jgi:hypothetical protein
MLLFSQNRNKSFLVRRQKRTEGAEEKDGEDQPEDLIRMSDKYDKK